MDVKSVNEKSDYRPYNGDIKVNLYDVSLNLMKSEPCKFTGIHGCTVYDYTIYLPGKYYIKIFEISSSSFLWTKSFTVVSGYSLSFFTFSISPPSPSAWQDFKIDLTLTDGCGSPFTDLAEVTLSSTNGISGELVKSTSTSILTFTVYCQNPGPNTVIASSMSVSSNTTLTVLQDLIKFIDLSPKVLNI